MGRKFKQLTFNDRLKMEVLLKAGHTPKEIAILLDKHISTIYRERDRGIFIARNSDETTEMRYSPDIAQEYINEILAAKGPGLKIGNEYAFANRIEEIIVNDKYSPAAALAKVKEEGCLFKVCVTTLYSYIDKGIFLSITNKNLPVKCKNDKRKYKKVIRQARASKGTSIEKRPEEVLERKIFGHWEMDTVVGKQGVSKKSLLVLTERKTLKELIFLLNKHTTDCVIKTLNSLEKAYGEKNFRMVFKSITVDNGSEFQDCDGMQKSRRNKMDRTKIYYCHPYCSCERGSNENQNKMVRRHIPKGTNFDNIQKSEVKSMEEWINNYPRKRLNYRTSNQAYAEELEKLNIVLK